MNELIIIGLTGKRQVGKSTIADHLVDKHGFRRLHPFESGKVACKAYLVAIGIGEDIAQRMIYGDLKDKPSPLLPDNQTPRYLMEEAGFFWGNKLGAEWTIGAELRREKAKGGDQRFIIESVVYEVDAIRKQGGVIVKVHRAGAPDVGHKTNAAVDAIVPDHEFINDGTNKAELFTRVDAIVAGLVEQAARRDLREGREELELEPSL